MIKIGFSFKKKLTVRGYSNTFLVGVDRPEIKVSPNTPTPSYEPGVHTPDWIQNIPALSDEQLSC